MEDEGWTASGYFGSMSEEYDSLIHRAVPLYDTMTESLVDYLPAAPSAVLELGCGTGNFSVALARHSPGAAFTFVDAAPEMIALTRARLAAQSPSEPIEAAFITARFEDLVLEAGSFDLVASCISLHHVEDKAALYVRLRKALRSGGALRFSDQLLGGSRANQARNWERWLEFCRQPGHCSEEEIRGLLDHAEDHDHYTPLGDHFSLLEEAGFMNVDCAWRSGMWGVVTADAP